MKTSKIKEITSVNEWDNPNGGKVYYNTLVMENGETISLGKKTENAFKVGDTVNWEDYTDKNGKTRQREVKENPFKGSVQSSKSAKIGMAIKLAFDLIYKEKGMDEAKKLAKEILLFANELEE